MSARIEVIAAVGGAPEAILFPSHCQRLGGRLLGGPGGLVFDAKLSLRWGCLVGCTSEFSAWWQTHSGRPSGFLLKVLTP